MALVKLGSNLRRAVVAVMQTTESQLSDHAATSAIVQSPRFDLPFLIERQLLSQEQNLCAQGGARAKHETKETKSVCEQINGQAKE